MRAKLPQQGRVRRARRREAPLRGLRRRRRDDGVPAALEHRALARLQGAAALFQRALPLHRLRSARQRQVRPAGRTSPPTRSTTTSPTALAVMDATRCRQGHPGRPFARRHARVRAGRASSRAREGRDPGRHRGDASGPAIPTWRRSTSWPSASSFEGWDKYNRDYWLAHYPDFAEHFVRNIFSEPHSTKQIEDGIEWANETTGPVLVKTVEARAIPPPFDVGEAMYRKIRCPLLLIHGDNDQIQPYARAQAGGRAHRRRARHHSGRRAQSARAAFRPSATR